jgi:hypothetical protein
MIMSRAELDQGTKIIATMDRGDVVHEIIALGWSKQALDESNMSIPALVRLLIFLREDRKERTKKRKRKTS